MTNKKAISLRIDANLIDWYREQRQFGYQTLMHEVLSDYAKQQSLKMERIAGRAQELFKQYHTQCFWHYRPNLEIHPGNVDLVLEGLKKYGGRKGLLLAEELCL